MTESPGPGRRAVDRDALVRLVEGRHHAPFEVLGPLRSPRGPAYRVHLPGARTVRLDNGPELAPGPLPGLFEWWGPAQALPARPRLYWTDGSGRTGSRPDPFAFPVALPAEDLHLLNEGTHRRLGEVLGAQPLEIDGHRGHRFAVWAPNAERVSVVGDFNQWDGRLMPMQAQGTSGVWVLFVPELPAGACYKYEIRARESHRVLLKSDPCAAAFEPRPGTASRLAEPSRFPWGDDAWMRRRAGTDPLASPVSVYEVHAGSWRRHPDGRFYDWRELAEALAGHVKALGFTHVELLPVTEHPFDGSWGYQTLGYFAPTSRHGSPDDFRAFVDHLHREGIGVLLDWVPAHFPRDAHGLARFDGSALYEHADPRRGEHRDWDTLIFNYGRNEVRAFLTSSALHWLREFHVDGLRVDAVASMLYLDYSRGPADWIPNEHGGNENLEAIRWLRELNRVTHGEHPGVMIVAEESTAWGGVTRPTEADGLGFTLKWNMGWMHDTLAYLREDPVHRRWHHDRLTFGLLYAWTENFLLPFSHDEVVHGKGSLLARMPGDEWQQFANLRLLYVYQFTYPGKKLLFMGCEFGQRSEWSEAREIDWWVLQYRYHAGVQALVAALNGLYRHQPALHGDHDPAGFLWLDCEDREHSVLAYLRRGAGDALAVVLNFTPVPRPGYRVGVPFAGAWREYVNSDDGDYGGSGQGDPQRLVADSVPWSGQPFSVLLDLPPLGGVVIGVDRSS